MLTPNIKFDTVKAVCNEQKQCNGFTADFCVYVDGNAPSGGTYRPDVRLIIASMYPNRTGLKILAEPPPCALRPRGPSGISVSSRSPTTRHCSTGTPKQRAGGLNHHRRRLARDQFDLFACGRFERGNDAGAIGNLAALDRAGAVGIGRHKMRAVELDGLEGNVPLAIVKRAVECGDDVINLGRVLRQCRPAWRISSRAAARR